MTARPSPSALQRPDDDLRTFRDCLGGFATGICVVTAHTGAEPIGMTVNSFSSVSLTPPLVLFSILRDCNSFEGWMAAGHYAIHVLGAHQNALSNRFAQPLSDKWSGLATEPGAGGAPLLPGCLGRLQCSAEQRIPAGDHVIFVGCVLAFDMPLPTAEPLVFFRGRYRHLADEAGLPLPSDALWPHGW